METTDKVYLYGASGHAKVVKDIAKLAYVDVPCLIDDNPLVTELAGLPVVHSSEGLSPIIVTIGDCQIRRKIVNKLGKRVYMSLVHYSFRQKFPGLIYPIRNTLWAISKWKSDRLKKFVLDFNPDIIFAPIYYDPFMARIAKYVSNLCNKKIISYTGDDYLTFKQFSLSPLY